MNPYCGIPRSVRISDKSRLPPNLDLNKVAPLINQGFMALDTTHLRATPKGRVVLDRLLLELLA